MELSNRLQAVADSVTTGNRVADVGCDHAYISIYLIEQGIAPSVIAMDVNKGPLARARENIGRKGYEARIQTRLSNGLEKMEPGEVDTILIAGMGGALMVRILEEGAESISLCKELVLQPQSEIHLVRRYLHKIGYRILEEQMLIDEGKYYVIIKGERSPEKEVYQNQVFYYYGKLLLERRDAVTREYLLREQRLRNQVINELMKNPTENAKNRLEEVEREMAYIEEGLSYF